MMIKTMTAFKSDFLNIISERGFIHQGTDMEALDKYLSEEVITAYIGFDCTADSLHVGSMTQIMLLRWLQKTGHKPVVLMGGGTTLIGDPTGRDEARKFLSLDDIQHNMNGIKKIFAKFLDFGTGETDAVMVNNADWLTKLNYLEFLRDAGKHFSINRMMTFESVKMRLDREQPLTFLEFNYMILQAYDFMHMNQTMNMRLQLGGSDQWGNIVNGVELTRRMHGKEVFGLTSPLLTTASGQKMGKTANGAVWLNEERLPSYDYWQFWRNTEDADVGKFLRLFTELPIAEIAKLEALQGAEINEAKKILAHEATRMCHGEHAALAAAETAQKVFEEGGAGGALPSIDASNAQLAEGIGLINAIREIGLVATNSEARRMIKQNAVKVNGDAVNDENLSLCADHVRDGSIKISVGKKKHGIIHIG
jgi:tyrosyl-tRNA synthetase